MERDGLRSYFDEIGSTPLLTEEQERQLSVRALNGDERAKNRLVEANLRFVAAIARQYVDKGLNMDDLISEGNVGLVKAASKYDASRGLRFANYAVVYIRRQIEKALQKESSEQRVESRKNGTTRSVDAPLGAKPTQSLLSVLADSNAKHADERTYSASLENAVEKVLEMLDERETQVVRSYYGIGQEHLTMAEIGQDMGLKRERVRQVRDRAVRRMKKALRQLRMRG